MHAASDAVANRAVLDRPFMRARPPLRVLSSRNQSATHDAALSMLRSPDFDIDKILQEDEQIATEQMTELSQIPEPPTPERREFLEEVDRQQDAFIKWAWNLAKGRGLQSGARRVLRQHTDDKSPAESDDSSSEGTPAGSSPGMGLFTIKEEDEEQAASAQSDGERVLASASATAGVGAPEGPFPDGGNDYGMLAVSPMSTFHSANSEVEGMEQELLEQLEHPFATEAAESMESPTPGESAAGFASLDDLFFRTANSLDGVGSSNGLNNAGGCGLSASLSASTHSELDQGIDRGKATQVALMIEAINITPASRPRTSTGAHDSTPTAATGSAICIVNGAVLQSGPGVLGSLGSSFTEDKAEDANTDAPGLIVEGGSVVTATVANSLFVRAHPCIQIKSFEFAEDARRGPFLVLSSSEAKAELDQAILDCAMRHPGQWLPIDQGMFVKLQAKKLAKRKYEWYGILPGPGGGRFPLPEDYLESAGFSRNLIRECKEKSPETVDCTKQGTSASSDGKRVLTSASATAGVGPEVRFPQGGNDYCLAYSCASAVFAAGDPKNAATIKLLAAPSLELPTGTNRIKWVQTECLERLQPQWQIRKLKLGGQVFNPLSLLGTPGVVTVMQVEDSKGFINHCIAVYDGWIFDANKPHAVPLSPEGLDACCLGGAHFKRVLAGFRLVPMNPKGCDDDEPPAFKKARNVEFE